MPIKVSCSCGAAFAAKDQLAGKTVKCPKCQQPLAIPGGAAAAAPHVAPPDPGAPSIFDEAGIKAKAHTGQVCPSCYHPMKAGTILCVHCGYSLQLGRKMEMQIYGRAEGGHGEAATLALQRAANTIEEDKREEKKKVSAGMPWWGYLLLFCAVVGLLTTMMLLPPASATYVALTFLWGLGFLLMIYCSVMIIIIAFKDNLVQGLCVLLIPCYAFIYCIMKWDQCGMYFLLNLASVGIQVLALTIMFFIAAANAEKPTYSLKQPIPSIRIMDERGGDRGQLS